MRRKFVLVILLHIGLHTPSKAQPADTVLIRQFTYSNYNADITNYTGLEGPDGLIFFSNLQGVLIYDGSSWKLIKIKDGYRVQSLLYDNDRIYVGSNNEFGYLTRDQKNHWQYTSMSNMVAYPNVIGNIWQIVKNSDGVYFVSYNLILFYNGKSIKIIDIPDSYIFNVNDTILSSSFYDGIRLIRGDSIIDELPTPNITNDAAFSILPSNSKNEFLYFTADAGAFKLTLSPLKLEPWTNATSKILTDVGFYCGIEYQDSLILCTTWRQGVILFNKKGDILKQIDIESGLPNRNLHELFIDSNANIWIPSRSGIYQMRLTLDKKAENFFPITFIGDINTENGPVEDIQNIFDPDYIMAEYTTPGFNQDDLEYSFFLEGHDGGWTPWSKQYQKEYGNFSNKNYTFHVKARVIGTTIESNEAMVSFKIFLPWYKRIIFYIGLLVFFILTGILVIRLRTLRVMKREEELEKQVSSRTQELTREREKLTQLNEELLRTNTELDNFVYRSSHDLIAPLKSLRGLMGITRLETSDSKMLEYVSLMETSVFKLENFIHSIMEYSINAKSDTADEEVDINLLLADIFAELKYFDKYSAIDFQLAIKDAEIFSDQKRLKIVLNNIITNAIKYHNIDQDKAWVKIKAERSNGMFVFEIEDNGLGIAAEHTDKIFDMFYRASEKSEGSGLGLYIVKDTMKKLHGNVKLTSTIDKGTNFILEIPVP